MKIPKSFFCVLFISVLVISCAVTEPNPEVFFTTSFKSARLDSIEKVAQNRFTAWVLPENEPVNKSPWFAFAVKAVDQRTIHLTMKYGEYQHRFIPKVSTDKLNWKPLEPSKITVDTLNHTAILQLNISPEELYVSAQEIETSEDTYAWVNNFIGDKHKTELKVVGKTALGNDNYVMVHENESVENSIAIIARQHPPEIPGGTIGFQSFYETLFSETETAKEFRQGFNIYTFPLINPDGADAGNWRHNANGVDLNRDWIEFSQPETKMVKDFIENKVNDGKKIRFALDFHTSRSGPYLLVLDSINEAKTSKIIPDWIEKIESNSPLKVEARRRSQKLPYCYNYFYNTFDAEAVTYEDGDEIDRDIIKEKARIYATELMKVLLEKTNKNG